MLEHEGVVPSGGIARAYSAGAGYFLSTACIATSSLAFLEIRVTV